jgi:hypothetical protein
MCQARNSAAHLTRGKDMSVNRRAKDLKYTRKIETLNGLADPILDNVAVFGERPLVAKRRRLRC